MTMRKREKCKSSLYFPWSHGNFDLEYLQPEILAAVEVYQRKLRVTEALLILEAERDQLVRYAKEFVTKLGKEWLQLYIAEACDSRGVLSFESYSRTLLVAWSAKIFLVRGLRNFVRG